MGWFKWRRPRRIGADWIDELMERRPSRPHLGAKRPRDGRPYITASERIDEASAATVTFGRRGPLLHRQVIKAVKRGEITPALREQMVLVSRRSPAGHREVDDLFLVALRRARRSREVRGAGSLERERQAINWRRSKVGQRELRRRRRMAKRAREAKRAKKVVA